MATRYYSLGKGCCQGLSITLCSDHLAARLSEGYKMAADRGPDSQPCHDCQRANTPSLPVATSDGIQNPHKG